MSLLHLVSVYWSIILSVVNSVVLIFLLWVIYGKDKDLTRAIEALSRICAAPVSARADSAYATEAQWMKAQARAALQGLGTKQPPPVAAGKDSQ